MSSRKPTMHPLSKFRSIVASAILEKAALPVFIWILLAWMIPAVHASDSDQPRPFGGTANGSVVAQIPPNQLVIEASGEATHLGRFRRTESLFFNPDGSFTGTIVFHAANGDQLHVTLTGAFVSATSAVGTYAIAGGTGRFVNATGEALFSAVTPNGQDVNVTFSGWISY